MTQAVEVHVGAGVDCDERAAPRVAALDIGLEASKAHSSRGLGNGARVLENVLHRSADLVRADGNDAVEQVLAQAEGLLARLPDRDTVREEPHLVEDDPRSRGDGVRHGRRIVRLDTEDLHLRPEELDEDRDARGKTTTADGNEDGVDGVRVLAQDLHAHRALPGDDIRVVIGVDEGLALLRLDLAGMGIGLVEAFAVQHHLAAAASDRLHLDVRGGLRHHDGGPDTEFLRGQRDTLRMIAGGGADDAALEGLLRQAHHLVVGAAQLERKHRLQVLALEAHGHTEPLRQPRHGVERALDGDVVDARGEDVADVVLHGRSVPSGRPDARQGGRTATRRRDLLLACRARSGNRALRHPALSAA